MSHSSLFCASPRRRGSIAILLLLLALAPAQALAWSEMGHRIVGALAQAALTPAAAAEVDALLAGEPEPSLAGIAAWPDTIRDLPEWKHTGPWHYLNFPSGVGCDFERARDCRGNQCVVGAIENQLAVLEDRSRPRAERANALKFVVHMVGDLHQPLHAGLAHDRGGNDFQVNLRLPGEPPQGTNLHAIWDRHILASREGDWQRYAELLGREGVPTSERDQLRGPVAERWAEESCRIMREPGAYPGRRIIGMDYLDQWRPTAEKRLREAGGRLATLLNEALD